MLNGRLTTDRADNGWIFTWHEPAPSFTKHVELCTDPAECLNRFAALVGMISGAPAARMLLEMAETRGHVDPATDKDVAAVAAPGTPPTVPVGD